MVKVSSTSPFPQQWNSLIPTTSYQQTENISYNKVTYFDFCGLGTVLAANKVGRKIYK